METNYKLIKKDIHFIKEYLKKVPTIEGMELSNQKLIETTLEKANERYASKTTEKIVYGAVKVILAGVILALLGLVLIK